MTFTFVCQACDDSFDVDYLRFAEHERGLKCPNCGKRLPPAELDELVTAVDDVLSQVSALRKGFAISFDIDAEDLPPPYDGDAKHASQAGDDDEEDEESDDDALEEDEDEAGADDDEDRF